MQTKMSLAYKQNNISIYTNGEQCFIYFGGDVGERLKEFTERKKTSVMELEMELEKMRKSRKTEKVE